MCKIVVRVENEETGEMCIGTGMSQCCSPTLRQVFPTFFNIYSEELRNEALEGMYGVIVGGETITAIKNTNYQVTIEK